jgi:hypothetical protein
MTGLGWCWYCGEQATGVDHVRARSQSLAPGGPTVDACGDCNNSLGSVPLFNTDHRGAFLLRKLSNKARRFRMPHWTAEQLEELDGRLRDYVKTEQVRTSAFWRRYEYMKHHFGKVVLPLPRENSSVRSEEAPSAPNTDPVVSLNSGPRGPQ